MSNTFVSERTIPFPREKVFQAWTNPELLATWWGPAGFTNTFEKCDITPGGDWIFTMIGPDGVKYPNISRWLEIEYNYIALEHVNDPHFFMKADFEEIGNTTKITWTMLFDTPEVLAGLKPIITPANEQNLDRLEACLRKM